jgi:Cysteine-rich secretory protein family
MSTLFPGQSLTPGQSLKSDNQLHTLIMQPDGNVVLYNSQSRPLWSTNTGRGMIDPRGFVMQTDGNLVLYDTSGQPRWTSHTEGNPGAFLNVQDDGNLVVYRAGSTSETAGNALWAAGSNDPAPGGPRQEMLDAQNKYRAEVGVPPLQWSDDQAASAQDWANQLAAAQQLSHNRAGQNVASGGGTAGGFSAGQLVDLWGSEKQNFRNNAFPDISTTGNWSDAGHYSQLVWRNTTSVGCGLATGQDGSNYLVCNYDPAGNVVGETAY